MDLQTVEQLYTQLQGQSQQSAQALQTLGAKLQTAAQSGDQQAREWSLDLRELALSFQAEQNQVANLLQSLHGMMVNQAQQMPQQTYNTPDYTQQQAPLAPQQQQQQGGFFNNFLNSGFARSVEAGAGFGIGDDIINKIF